MVIFQKGELKYREPKSSIQCLKQWVAKVEPVFLISIWKLEDIIEIAEQLCQHFNYNLKFSKYKVISGKNHNASLKIKIILLRLIYVWDYKRVCVLIFRNLDNKTNIFLFSIG